MQKSMILNLGPPLGLLAAAALLLCATWLSVQLSYADHLFRQNTPESVERAVALDPWNGHYEAWLAELLENQGRDSTAALEAAARQNPMDSRVWIRRGLNAELKGDVSEAERLLLHAAAIDKLEEPRWTLMNFYFRQQNEARFWPAARSAFAMSYGDRTPMFDLCWRVRPDATLIAARALPRDPAVSRQFMEFLLEKSQYTEAAIVAESAIAQASPAETPVFLAAVRRLLQAGEVSASVKVWNALSARKRIGFAPLDTSKAAVITNPRFEQFPSGAGFDWSLAENPELTAVKVSPEGLRISLSGKQGEGCNLLAQTIPVEPFRKYRLHFSYATTGTERESGLQLHIGERYATADLFSEGWRDETLLFDTRDQRAVSLLVDYHRRLGHVQTEGSISLRRFSLEFVD